MKLNKKMGRVSAKSGKFDPGKDNLRAQFDKIPSATDGGLPQPAAQTPSRARCCMNFPYQSVNIFVIAVQDEKAADTTGKHIGHGQRGVVLQVVGTVVADLMF